MPRYRVDRTVFVQHERIKEVLYFDAHSISFLSGEMNVLLIFKDVDDETIGAVDGFEVVRLAEPGEPAEPDTMAA